MRIFPILAALSALIVASCGPVDVAERTDAVSRTLTVREIDRDARSFDVTGDGQRFTLRVSEAVQNFDQIEIGDKLNVDYVESVAVSMADPEDAGETLALEGAATAAPGEKPGIAGGEFVSTVVEFVSYDPGTKNALVKTSDGDFFATKVPREMRRFAKSRVPGDRIEVDVITAMAVSISPANE